MSETNIPTYAGAFGQAAGATFGMKQTLALEATTAEVHLEVTVRKRARHHCGLGVGDGCWKIVNSSVRGADSGPAQALEERVAADAAQRGSAAGLKSDRTATVSRPFRASRDLRFDLCCPAPVAHCQKHN